MYRLLFGFALALAAVVAIVTNLSAHQTTTASRISQPSVSKTEGYTVCYDDGGGNSMCATNDQK